MPAKLNLVGLRFGSLSVTKEDGIDSHGATMWSCQCDCGEITRTRGSHLKGGAVNSCRCGIGIAAVKKWTTHNGSKTPLYRRWQAMKARCNNPNSEEYHNYGGRGIVVCDRWMRFENFRDDMADTFRPELEIDRRNTDGNYEPLNCRWITQVAQQRNKRTNHHVTIAGITKLLIEWSEETGIKANTILTRVRRGWPEPRLLELANK